MEKAKLKLFTFVKNHLFEVIILLVILALGAFLRLYKIEGFMTFLGDEGRDALIIHRLVTKGDFFLIGPGTSVGNMYLGPLYYYLITPAYLLANFSPVGPSVFIALLGVATIYLVWHVTRKWFGRLPASIVALLYSVSPVVIHDSRSSWNPHIMPFFSLLTVYAIWKIWEEKKYGWFIILGIAFAFVLQSHYLGIMLLPVIIFFIIKAFRELTQKDKPLFKKNLLYCLGIFFLLMSPLLIFDIRHGWMNSRALIKLLFGNGGSTFLGPVQALLNFPQTIRLVVSNLIGSQNNIVGSILLIFSLLVGLMLLIKNKGLKVSRQMQLLLIWFGIGLAGVAFFNHEIYSHYYGFVFTAPYLIFGGVLSYLFARNGIMDKLVAGAFILTFLVFSIINSPLKGVPNDQMQKAITVDEAIKKEAGGQRFNLAVIAESNYEDGYRYFLEKWGEKVVSLDPLRFKDSVTDQLFVVCEMPEDKCDPTHSPKAEVANFGWSKINDKWNIAGVVLYKLIHTK